MTHMIDTESPVNEVTVTPFTAGEVPLTVVRFQSACVRIVPHIKGGHAAYIGNGYLRADDIDDLIAVLQVAKTVMTSGE